MAQTNATTKPAATTEAEKPAKTAEERLAGAFGAFQTTTKKQKSAHDVERDRLQDEAKGIFAETLGKLQGLLGEQFGDAETDAAAKTAASLRRTQTNALKAIRSITDETLDTRSEASSAPVEVAGE